ncbi:alpha/beta fold hydrolase, partial [Kitasatospora sp. NPDC048296]|uniref:alpha/beta fold hydrolase n=1 Tax=Kitasatospora sp. NPDC048296 TaxID=3364048 RepID=UPI0037105EDD
RARRIPVDYASHSPQVEELEAELATLLAPVQPLEGHIAFHSTVTVSPTDTQTLDAAYWYRNLRQTVRFEETVRSLIELGHTTFVEVSPHPVLTYGIEQTTEAVEATETLLTTGTLRREEGGLHRFLTSLATLHTHGHTTDLTTLFETGHQIPLPTYAFQHQHYWLTPDPAHKGAGTRARKAVSTSTSAPADSAGVLRRSSGEERDRLLLDLVRAEAAAVLGHASGEAIDPGRGFFDLGFDSLTAVRLRNRLAAATGLRLPTALLFEHPTPTTVVTFLRTRLDRAGAAQPAGTGTGASATDTDGRSVNVEQGSAEQGSADQLSPEYGSVEQDDDGHGGESDGIVALFRHSFATGRNEAGNDLLMAASRLRASFGSADAATHVPHPVRLASGGSGPLLICFPAVVATAGPQQYSRIAAALRGRRDVVVLPQPGFVDGESIPESFEALVALQAEAVRRYAGDEPFVLLGHSAGGHVAHAVTERLEADGVSPRGLVLLDSPWPGTRVSERVGAAMLGIVFDREEKLGGGLMNATRLTAMGGYHRILPEWHPQEVDTPTLLVRATDRMPLDGVPATTEFAGESSGISSDESEGLHVEWLLKHDETAVVGDHFTIVEQHADSTAAAIEEWLDKHS